MGAWGRQHYVNFDSVSRFDIFGQHCDPRLMRLCWRRQFSYYYTNDTNDKTIEYKVIHLQKKHQVLSDSLYKLSSIKWCTDKLELQERGCAWVHHCTSCGGLLSLLGWPCWEGRKVNCNTPKAFSSSHTRTPAIVKRISRFNQTILTLALDLEGSSMSCYFALIESFLDQWWIWKHFPQSICILISHWLREK